MPMPLSRPVSSADLRTDNGALPPAPSPGGHHGEPTSGRVALKIGLERQCYVAGQQIRGVLEVHAKAKGLALGDIGIEFGGTEGQSRSALVSRLSYACPDVVLCALVSSCRGWRAVSRPSFNIDAAQHALDSAIGGMTGVR